MGAWGVKSFENDDAADWVAEFEEQGIDLVRETLDAALQDPDEDGLEASSCCEALAAAEMVAATRSGNLTRLSPEAAAALKHYDAEGGELASPENILLASESVERIRANSELRELWAETTDLEAWDADLEALQALLK